MISDDRPVYRRTLNCLDEEMREMIHLLSTLDGYDIAQGAYVRVVGHRDIRNF